MQHVENDLDNTLEKLSTTNVKLDEKDKAFELAEGEIQALQRKLTLLQDEHLRSENKLSQTTNDLNEASDRTDKINRAIKSLETKNMIDEERIDLLENQVKEAKQMVEESDIKFDEVARKLAMVEGGFFVLFCLHIYRAQSFSTYFIEGKIEDINSGFAFRRCCNMEHLLEGITSLRHWYLNPYEKSNKYISSFF